MFQRLLAGGWLLWAGVVPAPGQIPEDAAWSVLQQGARHEHAAQRSQAVAALSTLGSSPRAVRLVEAALGDQDWSVRQAAVTALGEMKSRASAEKLQARLDDEAPEVSFSAAKVLWDLGDRSGRGLLGEVLAGERGNSPGLVRGSVREARAKLRNPAVLLLMGAKEGVGMILFGPASMGINVVEELMKDNAAAARVLAVTLLAADRDPRSGRQVEDALADRNWVVRAAAGRALGQRGDRNAIPLLQERLTDEREAVRYMAAASIARLTALPRQVPPGRPASKAVAKAPEK